MISIISYDDEEPIELTDDQRRWFAVCDLITSHWYYMLTPDEFAALIRLKYPLFSSKAVRDTCIYQYYSEAEYRKEAFDDVNKRDTQLTPILDGKGKEYLVRHSIEKADNAEELIEAFKKAHGNKKMYIPSIDEMEEYFNVGFHPSNDDVMEAFDNLTELFPDLLPREQDYTAQGIVLAAIKGFETPVSFKRVCKDLIEFYHLDNDNSLTLIEQLRVVFNNTHLPANKGYTPIQLSEMRGML